MPRFAMKVLGYHRCLTPREELAHFLFERASYWRKLKVYRTACCSLAWANELDPKRQQHPVHLIRAMRCWDQQLRERLPPKHFPNLNIGLPPPSFEQLPWVYERELIRMQIMEDVLNNREYDRLWWEPMRRNPNIRPPGAPAELRIDYRPNIEMRPSLGYEKWSFVTTT